MNTGYDQHPGRPSPNETEVYLVGTRHIPTSGFNADTLYTHLEIIQPDVILLEYDSTYFNGDRVKWQFRFVFTDYQLWKTSLELVAASKYAKNHEGVVLNPFEWKMTGKIHPEVHATRSKMMRALYNTNGDTSNRTIRNAAKLRSMLKGLETLSSFNSDNNDSLTKQMIHLEYAVCPNLIMSNDSLNEYHELAQKFKNYWPERNQHMSDNIIKSIKANPNKRIAVLTGCGHRYLLARLLTKETKKNNFKLLDYKGNEITKIY